LRTLNILHPAKYETVLSFLYLRRVNRAEGAALSRQYTTLFGETSASDGRGVESALSELAAALRQKEDRDLERALKLSAENEAGKAKKKCCKK